MDEDRFAALVEVVMEDPKVQAVAPLSVTYIARYDSGVGNHFGFFYFDGSRSRVWVPSSPDAFGVARGWFVSVDPRPSRMVVVLRLCLVTDEIVLDVFTGSDADLWFVPVGEEGSLADQAK